MEDQLYDVRENIIFGEDSYENSLKKYIGDIRMFYHLYLDNAKRLIDIGALEKDSRLNNSPTVEAFMSFAEHVLKEYDGMDVEFFGYSVRKERNDYSRVTIDGIRVIGNMLRSENKEIVNEFKEFCQKADNLNIWADYLEAWWN